MFTKPYDLFYPSVVYSKCFKGQGMNMYIYTSDRQTIQFPQINFVILMTEIMN